MLLRRGLDLVMESTSKSEDQIAESLGLPGDRLCEICGYGRPKVQIPDELTLARFKLFDLAP